MFLTVSRTTSNWFFNILRTICAAIDHLIYTLVGDVVEGIFNLASLAANPNFTQVIYKRIYTVLALFMVFKLTFSFLQYLINPDAMNDKERGVGKLIARTLTMLAILLVLPTIFFESNIFTGQNAPILTMVQNGVIKTLPRVILGISDDTNTTVSSQAKQNGDYVAATMLGSLYYPYDCMDSTSTECVGTITNIGELKTTVTLTDSNGAYVYKYNFFITTICGGMLIFILVGIALDIAIRVFKIMILEMVAPIPVMSYIDPKSSKDGAFSAWLKTFSSAYLDIFVKLGTVYLLLLLIRQFSSKNLFSNNLYDMGHGARAFVNTLLILGLFKFAKEAPKFLKDALGLKDNGGSGFMDTMKTLGKAAGVVGGTVAGGAAGVVGGISAAKAAKENGYKPQYAWRALGGLLGGVGRGASQGAQGANKGNPFAGVSGALNAQAGINERKIDTAARGSTFGGMMRARFDQSIGRDGDTEAQKMEDAKNLNAAAKNLKTIRDTAKDKGFMDRSLTLGTIGFTDKHGRNGSVNMGVGDHALFKDAYEYAMSAGKSYVAFNGTSYDMVQAQSIYKNLGNAVADEYLSTYSIGSNATIDANFEEYRENFDKVSKVNKGSLSLVSEAKYVTKDTESDTLKAGSNLAKDVDYEASSRYKANRDAVKKSGK